MNESIVVVNRQDRVGTVILVKWEAVALNWSPLHRLCLLSIRKKSADQPVIR